MTQLVTSIHDLSGVKITIIVRAGWRARVARWLLLAAKWVGRNQLEFIGDAHETTTG